MVVKEHPEWSDKYPAVDGISKEAKNRSRFTKIYRGPKKPIRSDLLKILKLNDEKFTKWYSERKIAALGVLKIYELIGSIPNLIVGYEEDKERSYLSSSESIKEIIDTTKNGIDYLDRIKQVRNEYKKGE